MWICASCGQENDDAFDTCWNCGTSVGGVTDPAFSSASAERTDQCCINANAPEEHRPLGLKYSWFSFRLRTLLIAVAVVTFGLGWWFRPYEVVEPLPMNPQSSQPASPFGMPFDLHDPASTDLIARHLLRRTWKGEERYRAPLELYYGGGQLAARIDVIGFQRFEDVALTRFSNIDGTFYFWDGPRADSYDDFLEGKAGEVHAATWRGIMEWFEDRRVKISE